MRRALTIAGSDSGGGAGVQADLKVFHRFGVYGTSALTLVTAQNTLGVQALHPLPPELVIAQIAAVATDLGLDAAKTGALGSAEVVEAVAWAVERYGVRPLVVDPVMAATHGPLFLAEEAIQALKARLLPKATLVTPNLHEAQALLGRPIQTEAEMREAALALLELGPRAVLLKGGHLEGAEAVDYLAEGGQLHRLAAPRHPTPHTHGTGCTYAAAITALLARGRGLLEAVREAKAFVTRAIRKAPGLGRGRGPLNHWA